MQQIKVKRPDGNGYFNITDLGNIEYGDPILYYANASISSHITQLETFVDLSNIKIAVEPEIKNRVIRRKAIEYWQNHYQEVMAIQTPEELFKLLESTEKNEQLKLLRGISFTSFGLSSFIFKAFQTYGFLFSSYKFQHNPKDVYKRDMPRFSYKEDDNTITKIGNTTLTDGQIKSAILQRNVVVAKFLDRGDIWHCFFTTYRSLKGEENGGYPHYHYISSAFGRTREEVLYQLSQKNYKLPKMPHIELTDDEA
jgi:hypothetical protein